MAEEQTATSKILLFNVLLGLSHLFGEAVKIVSSILLLLRGILALALV